MLGLAEVGIEWDDAACATARAAGHQRVQADVAAVDPMDFAPCVGMIFSPPCPTFSNAGKGAGRRDIEHVIACALELAAGNDTRAEHRARCEDERSMLSVEPLRWALALKPEWIALEQVPPVLELWALFAQLLEQHGYYTWTGILEAERYGVPQTRERAIFMAHRDRPVHPPEPTHQRYVPGEPQRHDVTMLGEVLPWISMAEALGWRDGRRVNTRGERQTPGGNEFSADTPSWALTETARSWTVRTNNFSAIARDADGRRSKAGSVPYTRPVTEPAPTIDTHASGWMLDRRQGGAPPRSEDEPAHTMSSQGLAKGRDIWIRNNSNANASRRRGSEPAPTMFFGHSCNEVGWVADPADRVHRAGERVTIQEAAILQSFRPDYPWQGSRTKQFEQVGNAVPPLLARAVLSQLVYSITLEEAA